ncbi:MAG: T9SS type A sorting domain-containing protein [Bacteroidia bacterium]|nr:T9SS type A sorting domain-containing protein [Bacteroidia bacterium]
MRKSFFVLIALSAIFLSSCGDLVLFKQKIEGRNPNSLEGKYIVEFDVEGEQKYDTLEFRQVLPYQFIIYSSLVKDDSENYEDGHPYKRGEIYNGEIHQKGSDYFIQKKDEETGKWEIGAFRIKNGLAYHLLETLYYQEYNESLVNAVKNGKFKVILESEREIEETTDTDKTKKVYEVAASPRKVIRIWRSILRKSDRFPIRKLDESKAGEGTKPEIKISDVSTVYPNPTSGKIHISLEEDKYWQAELYDLTGKKLIGANFSGKFYDWDLSEMPSGTYILKLGSNYERSHKTFKIVKK